MDTWMRMQTTSPRKLRSRISVLRMRAFNEQIAIDHDCVLHQAPFKAMRRVELDSGISSNLVHYESFLVPLVDLRGVSDNDASNGGDCLVAEVEGRLIALRVDRIIDVLAVDSEQIKEASPLVGEAHDFLRGILQIQDTWILIVDLGLLFSTGRIFRIPAPA